MRIFQSACVLVGTIVPLFAAFPASQPKANAVIPDKYIVTFKKGVSQADIDAHASWVSSVQAVNSARGFATAEPPGLERMFNIHDFNAYAGSFDRQTVEEIKASPAVSYSFALYVKEAKRKARLHLSSPTGLYTLLGWKNSETQCSASGVSRTGNDPTLPVTGMTAKRVQGLTFISWTLESTKRMLTLRAVLFLASTSTRELHLMTPKATERIVPVLPVRRLTG